MGIKKLAPLVAAAALVGTFVFAAAAQANNPDTRRIFRITTANSLALDVQGGSTADDAPVIQWPVNGGVNQEWKFVLAFGGYEIMNVNSGKCLSVSYNSSYAGANLVQYACYGWSDQVWRVEGLGGVVSFTAVSSELSAAVPGNTPAWGKQLIQWPYSGWDSAETFFLTVLA